MTKWNDTVSGVINAYVLRTSIHTCFTLRVAYPPSYKCHVRWCLIFDFLPSSGYDLGATGRIALMAKLAEGTGFELPRPAQNALDLQMASQIPTSIQTQQQAAVPSIATQCFMLSNMFDPNTYVYYISLACHSYFSSFSGSRV